MDKLAEHCNSYKQALQREDGVAIRREKAWLTTVATTALLEQDAAAMQAIRACCADLSALADHFDDTGKPGDRWRTLGDVLTLALASGNPLAQLRLALPSTVTGLLMKHIQSQAGITPGELAEKCSKKPNHIANELKKLETAGLIYRLKRGKHHELYLSVLGQEALASIAPLKLIEQEDIVPKPAREFLYIDKRRQKEFGASPKMPSLKEAFPLALSA